MPTLQHKRATVAQNDNYIGEPGEIVVLTDDNYRAVIHDGTTSGGHPHALESEVGGGGGLEPVAHYDATTLGLSDGGTVSTWPDSTANNHNLNEGTGATYRASGINGYPAVEFNGSSDILQVNGPALSQPNTVFLVIQLNNTTGIQTFMDSYADPKSYVAIDSGAWKYASASGVSGGTADTNAHLITASFNGANSYLRVDGTQVAAGDPGDNQLELLTLGALNNPDYYLNGKIGEVEAFDSALSDAERDSEEQDLANKWGITL